MIVIVIVDVDVDVDLVLPPPTDSSPKRPPATSATPATCILRHLHLALSLAAHTALASLVSGQVREWL